MKVFLVRLSADQIQKAKAENGSRKKITHAVVCGKYGQIFGTERQCRKYFSAWKKIFPRIFDGGEEVSVYEPPSYKSTFGLVEKLIAEHDSLERTDNVGQRTKQAKVARPRKKGFLEKLLGK